MIKNLIWSSSKECCFQNDTWSGFSVPESELNFLNKLLTYRLTRYSRNSQNEWKKRRLKVSDLITFCLNKPYHHSRPLDSGWIQAITAWLKPDLNRDFKNTKTKF